MASSEKSWDDALRNAVASAGDAVKGIRSAYIQDQSALVKDNKVTEFRVNEKITFEIIK
jgi:hypothetical protein